MATTPSARLPDPWCFVSYDDWAGRIVRVRDHIGIEHCGPDAVTLCGRSLYPHGYPIRNTDPVANFFCKTCRAAAIKRGFEAVPDTTKEGTDGC